MTRWWSPQWAQHVEGRVVPRGPDDDPEDPLRIYMRCLVCGGQWQADCYSGHWDKRIGKFAISHMICWYLPLP